METETLIIGALIGVYRKELYEQAMKGLKWITAPYPKKQDDSK